MILGATAVATIIASSVINLRINNNMLTDLAKKGYTLKQGEMPAFRKEVKDINILNFIPIINLGYVFIHGGTKYANRQAHFGNLIMNGKIEEISKEKNDYLKQVDDKKRPRVMMRMRIREALGMDAVSEKHKTGATKVSRAERKKAKAQSRSMDYRRRQALLDVLSELDDKTKKMFEQLVDSNAEAKGRSK